MAACDADSADDFRRDFRLAQEDVQRGVTAGRATAADTHYNKWVEYTSHMGLNSLLEGVQDKIPIIQVFLHRVRHGHLSASNNKIRSRSAEDYVRSVAQTYLALGAPDPRLNQDGNIDFRLRRMLNAYKKADPPPDRVKPVPVAVLRRILFIAANSFACPIVQAEADLICIAFFYLLRPGEYSMSGSESTPFEFKDVQLFQGQRRLDLLTASDEALMAATFASLTFDKQKNSVRGEVIGQGRSGDPYLCPVKSLVRRIIHLRQHNASQSTPLATAYTSSQNSTGITSTQLTEALKLAVRFLGPSLGFLPEDVTSRSLRAAGANALLCGGVDTDVIRLIGRWRSDEMLRYLHTQAGPVMRDFSRKMLSGGSFTLIPNQMVPIF